MQLSVIIPTYNRKESLKRLLDSLLVQNFSKKDYEILIVDDGSTDGTKQSLQLYLQRNRNIHYFSQENKGPAAARNLGIKHSKGKYILFIDDDIFIPREDFFFEHIKIHANNKNTACLGNILLAPTIKPSEFMECLAPKGDYFHLNKIKDKDNCKYRYFITANISLERKWFEKDFFDENFKYAAIEDTDLGYRLMVRGLKIMFNKKASVYHYQRNYLSLSDFLNNMQNKIGTSYKHFISKHPHLYILYIFKRYYHNFMMYLTLKTYYLLGNKNFLRRYWKHRISYCFYE